MSNTKWNTTADTLLALASSKQGAYALATRPDGDDVQPFHMACWEAAVKANDAETAIQAHRAAGGDRGAIFELAMASKRLGVASPK